MILEVMREVRNTFWDGYFVRGNVIVKNGAIELNGSFSNGNVVLLSGDSGVAVYKLHRKRENQPVNKFNINEKSRRRFNSVYRLVVPDDFLNLVEEIENFSENLPKGGYLSEQFGEYRYTLNKDSKGWEDAFGKALNKYRKMRDSLLEIIST